MTKIVEIKKEKRLVLKKNWKIWEKAAGLWKNKKIINPLKWQRRIRKDRKVI
ncbi:MAG: hypothetical protein ACP5JU_00050 [Minisyncoccia bacterium]